VRAALIYNTGIFQRFAGGGLLRNIESYSVFREPNMKSLNLAVIRLLQFVVFALFTFIVSVYFGVLVLLPLDLVVLVTKLLGAIGIGSLFGAVIAVPVVAYLGKVVYSTPGLVNMLIENGVELVNMGKQRVAAFNPLLEGAK
jgi:hypothetical protein